jgi:PIN domain nuclease of toxin-antitoxin system
VSKAVLDASAILAVLHGETGFESVIPHLRGGLVSAVNFSEVLKKTVENGSDLSRTQLHLASFNLTIVPFDESHAVQAAELWPASQPYGLSMADRACISLGKLYGSIIVTADQDMSDINVGVEFEVIRRDSRKKSKA